jgi:hypothetical protein
VRAYARTRARKKRSIIKSKNRSAKNHGNLGVVDGKLKILSEFGSTYHDFPQIYFGFAKSHGNLGVFDGKSKSIMFVKHHGFPQIQNRFAESHGNLGVFDGKVSHYCF